MLYSNMIWTCSHMHESTDAVPMCRQPTIADSTLKTKHVRHRWSVSGKGGHNGL